MDKTEQYIWGEVKKQLPFLLEHAREYESQCPKISFPIMIDGVIDSVLYSKKLDKFIELRYSVGKGTCYKGFMDYYNDKCGYFDDVEFRTLDISDFPQ